MAIRIIAVGKKHESWVTEGIERYSKRLRKPFDIEWILLPHSSFKGVKARREESERILRRLRGDDFVILLDERGDQIDSPALSELLSSCFERHGGVSLVIGGAYGVSAELSNRADRVVGLSKLVFPHQLVRLVLAEQIYRAQEIVNGRSYHHE